MTTKEENGRYTLTDNYTPSTPCLNVLVSLLPIAVVNGSTIVVVAPSSVVIMTSVCRPGGGRGVPV